MAVPLDLENFAPSIDGTVEEWYAMDAKGWAKAAMTGKKLGFSFKGKRSVGDRPMTILPAWPGSSDRTS